MSRPKRIYFGGDLFDQKHLTGNALIGEQIDLLSNGKYKVYLPQDKELPKERSTNIRDLDIYNLLISDVAVFNFDGTDLDSGTVVEFCYAKMCDIPSVQLRTDFRLAGDQKADGDPWNVMASGYPRTKKVALNAMVYYQESKAEGKSIDETMKSFHARIAKEIIEALDGVCNQKSLFEGSVEKAKSVYDWAIKTAGGELNKMLTADKISSLVDSKNELQLI